MKRLRGTSIAEGLATGTAVYIEKYEPDIPVSLIEEEQIDRELDRALSAFAQLLEELQIFLDDKTLGEEEREVLSTHIDIIKDPEIENSIRKAISEKRQNAAMAVDGVFRQAIEFMGQIDNELFALRSNDFDDVRIRLLKILLADEDDYLKDLGPDTIPIFYDIKPSQVPLLKKAGVLAFVCETCAANSHAAIISRALKIGCVSKFDDLRENVKDGDSLIVDGELGWLLADPDDEALEYFVYRLQIQELIKEKMQSLRQQPALTKDGRKIDICLNVGSLEEAESVLELNADGIGLFRTEFIFLSKESLPTEDEQYLLYRQMAEKIAPKPLTIRTFDLGGDKLSHIIQTPKEENPYLGNRGIRFSLTHPNMFKTQLKAILRAATYGDIRIMFPMIMDIKDLQEAKRLLSICADELYKEGKEHRLDIPIGTMIEIPSAALNSKALAKECDFLSIGTNDLVQYTLAADRNNSAVSRYYIQHHPSVLMLIEMVAQNAKRYNKSLAVCGEMASKPEYVPLLIALGVNELSLGASSYYDVKKTVLNCDEELFRIVERADFKGSLPNITKLIFEQLRPYYAN